MKQSSEIGLLSLIHWSTGGSHEVLIEEQALVITPFGKKKGKKKDLCKCLSEAMCFDNCRQDVPYFAATGYLILL